MTGVALAPHVSAVGTRRRVRPIIGWAVVGGLQLVLLVYIVIRWAVSGDMHPTHHGPDTMPTYATVAMYAMQIGGVVACLYIVYRVLYLPWRRDGRVSADGMLLTAWFAVAIPNDILLSYTQYTFTYNSYYANAGSWLGQVPGIILPNAHRIPEPLLVVLPGYGLTMFGFSFMGCMMMQRMSGRWPSLRPGALVGITFVVFAVNDLFMEMFGIFLRMDAYPAVIRQLSLWPGTSHQLPLYQLPLQGAVWTAAAALRYFRDDRGRSVVERGVDDLAVSPRRKRATQQLALIGMTFALVASFNFAWQLVGAQANQSPRHLPSYLNNGVCGPATDTPCVGPHTPIYRAN